MMMMMSNEGEDNSEYSSNEDDGEHGDEEHN